MKHTTPDAFLTREILSWIRDERPISVAFIARCGEQCFHTLRKAGVITTDGKYLRLNRRYLSPDETLFVWGIKRIYLDEDRIDIVRRGPGGPPAYDESR